MRTGQERTLSAVLQTPPDTPPRDASEIGGQNPFTGATVANMNPALAEEMGLESADPGVTIVKIKRGSIANRLQFQPGDVVVKLNGRSIPAVADLRQALAQQAKSWTIAIRRAGETLTMTIGD
jgi:serine protease Do